MNNDINKYISVTQLNKYIKYKIDNDTNLNIVFLKGEISNFKAHTRGHFYFTLKDETSRINAIMFSSNTKNVLFNPQDGMKVLVTGRISVFESTGQYQIYVEEMQEDGIGALYVAFEQLKKKLEQEGLFRQEVKKQIPKIPRRVGVITAPTGAAIRDIISTIKRRWPLTEIYLFPALVQGEMAKDTIVAQIKHAQQFDLDTLIVGRGGGSIEDLWPFNEEIVAREIYNCRIPVISAVGHEIDFTISDFVSDLRAPTPTGAAEMAVPQKQDVQNYLYQIDIRLNKVINNMINLNHEKLNKITTNYIFKNPISIYEKKELFYDTTIDKLKYTMNNLLNINNNKYNSIVSSYILTNPIQLIDNKINKFEIIVSKLETLSPLLTIKRGYTLTKLNNKVITSSKKVKKGDTIEIEFSDGTINSKVI